MKRLGRLVKDGPDNHQYYENRNHLQMAYSIDDYLFTHAGVSSEFMDNVFGKDGWKAEDISALLNEQFWHKPKTVEPLC